jgi:hypothetical protein
MGKHMRDKQLFVTYLKKYVTFPSGMNLILKG